MIFPTLAARASASTASSTGSIGSETAPEFARF